MKKLIMILVLLVLTSAMAFANFQIGEKIDDVLYTDIVTEINGQAIESFNINGSTAIYVTEAKKLGYDVIWNGDKRLVRIINDEAMKPTYSEEKLNRTNNNNYKIGDKINDVLYTDIKTRINGEAVESFNIAGSTAIYVSALQGPKVTVQWLPNERKVRVLNITDEELSEKKPIPDNAVARVNDIFIDEDTFNKNVAIIKYLYEKEYGKDIWNQSVQGFKVSAIAKEQTLDRLIQVALIRDYMKNNLAMKIDDEKLTNELEKVTAAIADDEERKAYYAENGISNEFIYNQLKDNEYMTAFSQIIETSTNNTFDINNHLDYVTEVDASHILVADEETAKKLYQRLLSGAEFSELAKEYSTDPGTKDKGGHLGYFSRGKMVEAFETVAFSLDSDSISEPFETQFGYHLVKVNDQKTIQDMINNESDEETIKNYKNEIIQKLFQENYKNKIETLKNNSTIEKYIDDLKS